MKMVRQQQFRLLLLFLHGTQQFFRDRPPRWTPQETVCSASDVLGCAWHAGRVKLKAGDECEQLTSSDNPETLALKSEYAKAKHKDVNTWLKHSVVATGDLSMCLDEDAVGCNAQGRWLTSKQGWWFTDLQTNVLERNPFVTNRISMITSDICGLGCVARFSDPLRRRNVCFSAR